MTQEVEIFLDMDEVVVQYLDKIVTVNSDAKLSSWPMPDYCCDVLSQLL